jgi:hypothetical protein
MTSSASIAQHIAVALVGLILAGLFSAVTAWLWPGMGVPAFIAFLLSWGIERINTIALERRHPELILSPGWKYIRLRYKPPQLRDDEYEITLSELIRGQIAVVVLGVPVGLLVAGLIGLLLPPWRWPAFLIVLGVWTTLAVAGIIKAVKDRSERY